MDAGSCCAIFLLHTKASFRGRGTLEDLHMKQKFKRENTHPTLSYFLPKHHLQLKNDLVKKTLEVESVEHEVEIERTHVDQLRKVRT